MTLIYDSNSETFNVIILLQAEKAGFALQIFTCALIAESAHWCKVAVTEKKTNETVEKTDSTFNEQEKLNKILACAYWMDEYIYSYYQLRTA